MKDYRKDREKSKKQEKQIAKRLGGKVQIASGSLWTMKGDARSKEFLCECKITSKKSYSVKFDIWDKIRKEAIKDGIREPLMNVQLEDGKYSYAVVSHDWCFNGTDYDTYTVCKIKKGKSFVVKSKFFELNKHIARYAERYIKYQRTLNDRTDLVVMSWSLFEEILEERGEITNE